MMSKKLSNYRSVQKTRMEYFSKSKQKLIIIHFSKFDIHAEKEFTYKPSIAILFLFTHIPPSFLSFLPLFFLSLFVFSHVLATIRRCLLVHPSIHWFHLFLMAYFAVLRLAETAPAQPYATNVVLHMGLFSTLLCYLPFFSLLSSYFCFILFFFRTFCICGA